MFKICHIAAATDGATWMVDQLRELRDRKGYDVSAIISEGRGTLANRLKNEGIPYHKFDFDFPTSKGWGSVLKRVFELGRLLRNERYDVVHTHLFASMFYGRLAAWITDVPVRVAMVPGPYHLEAYTSRWIDLTTCWMDSSLIASCEYTRTHYKNAGVPDNRLHLVYYGPDASGFNPRTIRPAPLRQEFRWPDDTLIVAMVSYFYPTFPNSTWTPSFLHNRSNKRQIDLIHATPEILRVVPNTKILMIGSGWGKGGKQTLEEARMLVAELGLEESVIFAGSRNDISNILAAADVAVQASLSENLGGSIEALLMECPLVATRSGGLVDSVKDGETGILVTPLDPEDLARGVIRLLRDPLAARAMATAGRALMLKRFTLKHTIDELDGIYQSLLHQRQHQMRPGFRPWMRYLRLPSAGATFAYLAVRLACDAKMPTYRNRSKSIIRNRSRNIIKKVRAIRPAIGAARTASRQQLIRAVSRAIYAGRRAFRDKRRSAWIWLKLRPLAVTRAIYAGRRAFRDKRRSAWIWLKLQPLYLYGYIRHLMRGTEVLRRWDVFFARIRGRE